MPGVEADRCLPDFRYLQDWFPEVPCSERRQWDACATVRCCHRRLNPKEGGEHLMRPGTPSRACLWLGRHQSPAIARLRQGTTAPAAIALGADLAPRGDTVLVLVGELVDLVCQLLHRARPETAAKTSEALEVIHTLAVALDSDAGGVRTADLRAVRSALQVLGPNKSLGRLSFHVSEPGGIAAGHSQFPLPTTYSPFIPFLFELRRHVEPSSIGA